MSWLCSHGYNEEGHTHWCDETATSHFKNEAGEIYHYCAEHVWYGAYYHFEKLSLEELAVLEIMER